MDEGQLTENGLKVQATMVGAVAAASGNVPVAIVAEVVVKVFEIYDLITDDTTFADAIQELLGYVTKFHELLTVLDARLDELVPQIAVESNRVTLRSLLDYDDECRALAISFNAPDLDLNDAVDVAIRSGILADKFLRNDFDIWRWTDVVLDPEPRLDLLKFKHLPTLPIYFSALLTWLAAREKVVQMGGADRLVDDKPRIQRHLSAISIRSGFDKYLDGELGKPITIAENIKWRIRAFPIASDRYAVNRTCRFYFDMQNWMSGERLRGDPFDIVKEADGVLCTVDPRTLGTPSLELEAEAAAGIHLLAENEVLLQRVLTTGTLRQQFIGEFSTDETFAPAIVYVVLQNGDLIWLRHDSASQPGGSHEFSEPKNIKTGWGRHARFFHGGGASIYSIDEAGNLFGQTHEGFMSGKDDLSAPVHVGAGWNAFPIVFSGGESVIYGVESIGKVRWHKHVGGPLGSSPSDWTASRDVTPNDGWPSYKVAFSSEEGKIYGVAEDNGMYIHEHRGWRDGTTDWASGYYWLGGYWGGWTRYSHVIAAPHGVFYCLTRDGELHWYRNFSPTVTHASGWEGPITVLRGLQGARAVFTALLGVPSGVH